MPPKSVPKLSAVQKDSILAIGKVVRATRYKDHVEQRAFLDEKTEALDSYSPFLTEICETSALADVAHVIKNSYHQSAGIGGGVIAGRYPLIVDFCTRLKGERERLKNLALLQQQQHRVEIEDVCAAKEAQDAEVRAAKEAARASKEAAKKVKKSRKSKKVSVDDIDDEVSVVDDTETPATGSGEVDDPMLVDGAESVSTAAEPATAAPSHRQTQSLDKTVLDSNRPDISEQRVIAEQFSPPTTHKRTRQQSQYAHEDSSEQFDAAELAVNNERVKHTVATAHAAVASAAHPATIGSLRLEESDLRSRIAFTNAQLRYELNHREYLLGDLQRVLDAQHQRQA
ncbi:hypothetical protein FB451DRAFT_1491034 [Mycena latifolia]|nr:hypothetical protein FB451DRAFT_1491034 [Mycena latifolia]